MVECWEYTERVEEQRINNTRAGGLEGPMEWKVTTWANAATVSRLIQSARSSVVGQFLHLWISVPAQANGLCCASFHIWAEACTAALHDSQVKTIKCGRRRATIHQYNFFLRWFVYSSEFTFCLCKSLNGRQRAQSFRFTPISIQMMLSSFSPRASASKRTCRTN